MEVTNSSLSRTELRVADLEKKNATALEGGGADRIAKHKEGTRLTARERLDVLLEALRVPDGQADTLSFNFALDIVRDEVARRRSLASNLLLDLG